MPPHPRGVSRATSSAIPAGSLATAKAVPAGRTWTSRRALDTSMPTNAVADIRPPREKDLRRARPCDAGYSPATVRALAETAAGRSQLRDGFETPGVTGLPRRHD